MATLTNVAFSDINRFLETQSEKTLERIGLGPDDLDLMYFASAANAAFINYLRLLGLYLDLETETVVSYDSLRRSEIDSLIPQTKEENEVWGRLSYREDGDLLYHCEYLKILLDSLDLFIANLPHTSENSPND